MPVPCLCASSGPLVLLPCRQPRFQPRLPLHRLKWWEVGCCGANCCDAAGAISVSAGGACTGAGGATGASACPTLPSGGAEVYTVVKSVVNLTSHSTVMLWIEGQ